MKDPAFLFYPNDYIGGTMGMTFEEKGAYMDLLMLQFNRGHMTSHMIGQVVGQLFGQIKDKFKVDENGLYYNQRLDDEIKKRQEFVASRKNNISGSNQYSKKRGHMGGHVTSHMENEDVNENENVITSVNESSFDLFWKQYPRKVDKSNAEKAFKKIKLETGLLNVILDSLECWKKSQDWTKDGGRFIPYPATWLNGKRWEDEAPPRYKTEAERIFDL